MTLCLALAATLAALALPASAVGHRVDLAILDRATGNELPVHWHEGRAYVVGRPGNEYQVVVRNRRGEDLLAVVSVDGVNVVSGETASPQQSGYVISPWQRLDVRGWRKSLSETAAFYFTSLGDSYAGRTGRPNDVGVIGVALFERKAAEPSPPPRISQSAPRERAEMHERAEPARKLGSAAGESGAAPAAPAAAASADAGSYRHAPPPAASMPAPQAAAPLGTGHGRRETDRVRNVRFDRATPEPVETIAIHYDSYRNLVAMGVLTPYASRRHPDPFPQRFTPDP